MGNNKECNTSKVLFKNNIFWWLTGFVAYHKDELNFNNSCSLGWDQLVIEVALITYVVALV